jgi:rRNA maturation protein Nop10
MSEHAARVVFVAEHPQVAEAVIQLLASAGIAAELQPPPEPESSPLTGLSSSWIEEFPVIVTNPQQWDEAQELLATAEKQAILRAVREKRASRTGTVSATCEDCGRPSEWPATAMGTTEVCPHCGAYMDVPDPDDDWSDMDFGQPEDAESEGT